MYCIFRHGVQLFLCDAIVGKTPNADRAVERLQSIADNATDLLWGGLGLDFGAKNFTDPCNAVRNDLAHR